MGIFVHILSSNTSLMSKNVRKIIKRDGKIIPFQVFKIARAIHKAFDETGEKLNPAHSPEEMADEVASRIETETVDIEAVQDLVEKVLMENGYHTTAKAYIVYREERSKVRDKNSRLMRTLNDMVIQDAKENNILRENANVNGNTPMGSMLKFGSETAKAYVNMFMLDPEIAEMFTNGDIHPHDLDFYQTGTTTCTQIDLTKLFEHGFSTGHGYLRKPNSIASYAALTAIAIQANQNDQHGGQSIPDLDRMLAPGVVCSFRKNLIDYIAAALTFVYGMDPESANDAAKTIINHVEDTVKLKISNKDEIADAIANEIKNTVKLGSESRNNEYTGKKAIDRAIFMTNKQTYQAMEGLIHNLNTMNSRAGAQVPFSSVNYGTDTSPEARMIIKNLLLATEAGLGNGETPIFPIQIFRCKHGVNMAEGEPNYDLFKLACRVSSKRLFPNFSFQDAPFNAQFYKEGHPETEIAYMGCRTRVIGNVNGPEISYSRGNLSFTSINLPRIGIIANGDWDEFYKLLDERMAIVKKQLVERFEYQCKKKAKNFPFVMQQGVWLNSETLAPEDELTEILKNGTLTIGFIGLAETLVAMMGCHHGESEEAQEKGLEIIRHMREFTDKCTADTHLNFSLIATPAEGLSGRFTRIDKKKYGVIPGVTDREYYTNSFHVPVYYDITAFDKIKKEAPYHELTNGGHISYIELDGDSSQNPQAFEKVVLAMDKAGIGYGAINHPVDRDPCCGYSGIISHTCPKCDRKAFHDTNGDYNGINFDRIRRITGYLVGTLDRFNDGKRAEEADRVKHQV